MNLGDEELMAMFSAGMEEAFDMLYERYRNRLFRFCCSCGLDVQDAEDIVQEVFIRVAKSAARYQPMGRFKAWIFQIAANRVRSYCNAEKPFNSPDTSDLLTETPWENQIIARDLIYRILSRLSQSQRMIVVLKDVEGLSSAAIADVLSISPENVRVQLHRARQNMISFLNRTTEGIRK